MLILVTTAEKNKYILQSSGVRGNEYAQLSHFSAEQYYTVVHVSKKFGSEILSGRTGVKFFQVEQQNWGPVSGLTELVWNSFR